MKPVRWIGVAGTCAVIACLCGEAGYPVTDVSAADRQHGTNAATPTRDFSGDGSCTVTISGYRVTGYARVKMVKSGRNVTATVTEYRIAGADSGRKKANVNSDLRVWDNTDGSGGGDYVGMFYSKDAMLQDGQWHTLNQAMSRDVGYDVKRARAEVQFIFDTAGGDPSCWAKNIATTF